MMTLDNQVAVLTGAASGIGRALAQLLAKHGCNLALIDRDEAGLQQTLSMLPQASRKYSTHVVDLLDRQAIRELPDKVLEEHQAVHLVINNAGVALGGAFSQVSEEDFDWVIDINFRSVVDVTRAFLPVLRANRQPCKIVNVSSLFGLISPPGQVAYSASKFAVRGFSNGLRHELQRTNVSVAVVHPGGIATSIANNAKVPTGIDPAEAERQKKETNKLLKMPADKAAEIIVRGIVRDKARIIVGMDAKVMSVLERLLPVKYWEVVEKLAGRRRGR